MYIRAYLIYLKFKVPVSGVSGSRIHPFIHTFYSIFIISGYTTPLCMFEENVHADYTSIKHTNTAYIVLYETAQYRLEERSGNAKKDQANSTILPLFEIGELYIER